MLLPTQLRYVGLVNYLSKKLNLPELQNRFNLTYKSLSSGVIVELLDTEMVRNFLAIGVQISPEDLRLYLCDLGDQSSQANPLLRLVPYEPKQIQETVSAIPYEAVSSIPDQQYQNQYHSFHTPYQQHQPPYQSFHPFPAPYELYQRQYQSSHAPYEPYQSHYQTPYQSYETPFKLYENQPVYQYKDLPSDYGIRISEVSVEEYDVNLDQTENSFEKYKVDLDPYYGAVSGDCLYHPNTDEFLGIHSDSSDTEPDEEDKEESEKEDKEGVHSGNISRNNSGLVGCNLFWGMPPPLSTLVPIMKPNKPVATNYQHYKGVK